MAESFGVNNQRADANCKTYKGAAAFRMRNSSTNVS